jgi:hypothetical protein
MTALATVIVYLSVDCCVAHAQPVPPGCPGRWVTGDGGMMCRCADGSFAKMVRTQIICGPGQQQTKSQLPPLQRCLDYYIRTKGPFAPEGHSTPCLSTNGGPNPKHCVKSKSDWTMMCRFAIAQKNYFFDRDNVKTVNRENVRTVNRDNVRTVNRENAVICIKPVFTEEHRLRATIDGTPQKTDQVAAAINYLHERYCREIEGQLTADQNQFVGDNCYQYSGVFRGERVFWGACLE